jgi:ABC-type Zn uptake system ZnuABC Zn-binding protein ZnuA
MKYGYNSTLAWDLTVPISIKFLRKGEIIMKCNIHKVVFACLFAWFACIIQEDCSARERPIQVVTTTTVLSSIVESIGGDRVEVTSIATGHQDPHFVEAKPSYMMKVKNADLFIRIGMELEIGWERLILDGSRNHKVAIGQPGHLDVSEGVERLEVPTQKIDRSMGDLHPFGNPHYWLDPLNGKIVAKNISMGLARVSPADAEYFNNNYLDFAKRVDEAMVRWTAELKPYKGSKLITYHNSWTYITNRFGLVIVDQLEPKPGIPPGPGHIVEVIEKMKNENIKVLLMEPFYDKKPANFVQGKTGAKVVSVANCVGGSEESRDYIFMIDAIVVGLANAFKENQ